MTHGAIVGLKTELLTIEEAGPRIEAAAVELRRRLNLARAGKKKRELRPKWGKAKKVPLSY